MNLESLFHSMIQKILRTDRKKEHVAPLGWQKMLYLRKRSMPRRCIAFQDWLRKLTRDDLKFKYGNDSDVKMFDLNSVRFKGRNNKLKMCVRSISNIRWDVMVNNDESDANNQTENISPL